MVLYFEKLGRSEICPTIFAFKTSRVANQKEASVLVYDFYDQSRRARYEMMTILKNVFSFITNLKMHFRSFYQVDPASLCDICDDCYDQDCEDKPNFLNLASFQFGNNVDFHSSANKETCTFALATTILVALTFVLKLV